MATQIKLRRDTDTNWTANSTVVLGEGEIGVNLTTGQFKLGNGTSTWAQLSYFQPGAGDSVVNGAYNITLDTTGDFVPSTDNLQDLGSPTNRFRHLYVGPGSVYIGNNVITEAATGSLVLPGVTRATGYYADEVNDDDDWGSNPIITGSVTVIDASRYRIISGQVQASGNYNPALYTVQKDGNRVDEVGVDENGSGWTKTEADYARDNNMYATNVAGAINTFNAGDWTQIPFRVEIKAEDTVYEDIFGGSGDRLTNGDHQVVLGSGGNITIPKNKEITLPASTDEDRYGGDISIMGQRGYGNWSTEGNAGFGSSIYIRSGDGGENNVSDQGGEGGEVWIRSGDGQAGNNGGTASLIAGNAKFNNSGSAIYGGNVRITAGNANEDASGFGRGGNVDINAGEGDHSNGSVNINTTGGDFTWTFDPDGVLTFPTGGQIANYPDAAGASNNSWFVTPGGENGNGGVSSQDGQQYIQINNNLSVEIGTSYGTANESIWRFGQDGDLTLPAGGDIKRSGVSVLGGAATSYAPDDTDNWNDPTINTISAALDELAARITAFENFEIDGGNANTPDLGELLIDGNGA